MYQPANGYSQCPLQPKSIIAEFMVRVSVSVWTLATEATLASHETASVSSGTDDPGQYAAQSLIEIYLVEVWRVGPWPVHPATAGLAWSVSRSFIAALP